MTEWRAPFFFHEPRDTSSSRCPPYFASLLPRRTPLRISTEPFAEYRETSSVGRVLPWFADGPLLASSPRRKSSGVSKAIAIWALSFTRLEANRNLLTAMSLLPKSIHRCRRYPTKFNSGRDIPAPDPTAAKRSTSARAPAAASCGIAEPRKGLPKRTCDSCPWSGETVLRGRFS